MQDVRPSADPGLTREHLTQVRRYHDDTKHHFDRFARSLGFLDWASQPRPFRSFHEAPSIPLYPRPDATGTFGPPVRSYSRLFAANQDASPAIDAAALGTFLRYSLGLSAWKAFRESRWALRVNPSSGNLHPTEAYVVTGPLNGLSGSGVVWHYAPDRHVIEQRCAFPGECWRAAGLGPPERSFLVVLTSIHWRESWKYGERAFRYCQHDLGHAVAALSLSGAMCGWRTTIWPAWPHDEIGALAGIDRAVDYVEAEREEPACVLRVSVDSGPDPAADVRRALLDGVRGGRWTGRASQLSEDHVAWTFIDEVARATADPGHERAAGVASSSIGACIDSPMEEEPASGDDAPAIILQRRSAVAFDGSSAMSLAHFRRILSRTLPSAGAPWHALWWRPRIHLLLFVHRVEGLAPGLYLWPRDDDAAERIRADCGEALLWDPVETVLPLVRLMDGDQRSRSKRLSCDQDIAADGFFSLGMLAQFDASLDEYGPSFYRQLFWESGVVGQVLYLEAEAAGARGTGIGCFYDDGVHELLGLRGHAFQSLYHFTVGAPVEDRRLTIEPGYPWERRE